MQHAHPVQAHVVAAPLEDRPVKPLGQVRFKDKAMRPTSLSYGPVEPKDRPSATLVREVIVTPVTSADVESG